MGGCNFFTNTRLQVINSASIGVSGSLGKCETTPSDKDEETMITYDRARQLCHTAGGRLYEPMLTDSRGGLSGIQEILEDVSGIEQSKAYWIGVRNVEDNMIIGDDLRINKHDSDLLYDNISGIGKGVSVKNVMGKTGLPYKYVNESESLNGAICEAYVKRETTYTLSSGGFKNMTIAVFSSTQTLDVTLSILKAMNRDNSGAFSRNAKLMRWPVTTNMKTHPHLGGVTNPSNNSSEVSDMLFDFVLKNRTKSINGLKRSYLFWILGDPSGRYNALKVKVYDDVNRTKQLRTGGDLYKKPKVYTKISLYLANLSNTSGASGFIYVNDVHRSGISRTNSSMISYGWLNDDIIASNEGKTDPSPTSIERKHSNGSIAGGRSTATIISLLVFVGICIFVYKNSSAILFPNTVNVSASRGSTV